jgi:hypothetical protein
MYGIYEDGKVIAKFVAPMTVRSNQPIFVSDTLSLRRLVSKRSAQRWEIQTLLEPLTHTANELFVSLVSKGSSEIVNVLMPQNIGVIRARKIPATVSNVTVSGALNATQFTVSGVPASGFFMPKGCFIRFSNHSKIYMTTTDVVTSGSVGIYPPLKLAVGSGVSIFAGDDVIGSFRYDTDVVKGMAFTDGILMDVGTVNLVEDV